MNTHTEKLVKARWQAEGFFSLAEKADFRTNPSWLVPQVVNLAFAAELFLKTLHLAGGNEIFGHQLNKLYDNLPQKLKRKIFNKFKRMHDQSISRFSNKHPNWGLKSSRAKTYAKGF
jgi:hypothetical protein